MPLSNNPVEIAVGKLKVQIKTLPKVVANEALNFTLDRFKSQNWTAPWPRRKVKTAWGTTPRNNGRAVLIDKGRLRRGNRIAEANWNVIRLANDVPYAKAHNDGFNGTVTQKVGAFVRKYKPRNQYEQQGKKRFKTASGIQHVKPFTRKIKMNMPRRRFMGNHPLLPPRLRYAITMHLAKNK